MVIFVCLCFFPSAFTQSTTGNDIHKLCYTYKRDSIQKSCVTHIFTDWLWDCGHWLKSRPKKQFSRQKSNHCSLNFQVTHVLLLFAYSKPVSALLWKTLHLSGPTALFWNKFILVLKWVLAIILSRDRRRCGPSSPALYSPLTLSKY